MTFKFYNNNVMKIIIKNFVKKIFPKTYCKFKQIRQFKFVKNFYSQFITEGDLCFDVGANIGNKTEIFLQLGYKVVAVEPQDYCVRILLERFGLDSNFHLINSALGQSEGQGELMIAEASTISSMSNEWIKAVKNSGRFTGYSWTSKKTVNITTLDNLIKKFGKPKFIKIDVEGFEYEVLKGISQPVNALCFEFTPEFIESTIKCLSHLNSLGNVLFNYTLGEELKLILDKWVDFDTMQELIIKQIKKDNNFGDIYAKFINII